MTDSEFADALGEGATLVTPNKRLARHFVFRHDATQRDSGRPAWASRRCIPWPGWLRILWLDVIAAGVAQRPLELVSQSGAGHLWDRIVTRASPGLLDTRGAAAQAAEAWTLFHAWREPADRLQGWSRAGIGDDAATFSRWAQQYANALSERELLDSAQLPDALAEAAPRVAAWRGRSFVMAGFLQFTPQQRRLLAALSEAGAEIAEQGLPAMEPSSRRRVACATVQSELDSALAWARERALADPSATIGIVIDDLPSRREDVAARAEDILCPALASRVLPDAPRPFAISLGVALGDVPVVTSALDLIALGAGSLPIADAAALLRSPYIPDADRQWMRRAAAERRWRERGLRTINFSEFVQALAASDADLAAHWRAIPSLGRGARSPAQWASDWREWLRALGWPGGRPLGSGEWQACEAWSTLLAELQRVAAVTPEMTRDEALRTLRSTVAQSIFQPESPLARIQILGVLEASGLDFDALWIAGMTAERWPPALQPNPLLPLKWQRDRRMPRADPAVDLAHARALTTGFAVAAHEVVVSHASTIEGYERAGSALFEDWEECAISSLPTAEDHVLAIAAQHDELMSCDDERAPELPVGTAARGGVGIIESQSTCPFQAFARYRLRSDSWPEATEGLTAQERGILLHATLAALWDALVDQATLRLLTADQLDLNIAAAVASARHKVDRSRWQSLPPAVASGENQRLAGTVKAWLVAVDACRPSFAVRHTELPLELNVGGVGINVRIDRVDTLTDGGIAVIDYKSGRAAAPSKWLDARPSGTQVGQYALALGELPDAPEIRALVYAQLKAGEIGVQGMTADESVWPPLKALAQLPRVPVGEWADLPVALAMRLGELAEEFREGVAIVAPRDGRACQYCDLHALCRIQSLDDTPNATAGNDDE